MKESGLSAISGTRTPKADLTAALANYLEANPKALDVPEIDNYAGIMHKLFTF